MGKMLGQAVELSKGWKLADGSPLLDNQENRLQRAGASFAAKL